MSDEIKKSSPPKPKKSTPVGGSSSGVAVVKKSARAKASGGSGVSSTPSKSATSSVGTSVAAKVVRKKVIKKVREKRTLKPGLLSTRVQESKFGGVLVDLSSSDLGIKIPADAVHKVGKRKASIARVWVWPIGKGQKSVVMVNGRDPISYFNNSPKALLDVMKPFLVIDESISNYCVVSKVCGGGVSAQSEAARLGISKCLLDILPHMRPALKKEKLLRRDARVVEPKKTGLRGARKREQFSKR